MYITFNIYEKTGFYAFGKILPVLLHTRIIKMIFPPLAGWFVVTTDGR